MSVMASPSSSQATKQRRSSITGLAFHGINTSRQKAKSVTHVSGTKCHLSLRLLIKCLWPFAFGRQPGAHSLVSVGFFCVEWQARDGAWLRDFVLPPTLPL